MKTVIKIVLGVWIVETIITNWIDPSYGFDSKKKYYFHGVQLKLSEPPCEFNRLFDRDIGVPIKFLDWIPEEIPRNVSFYVDVDGDNKADIIFANPLIEVIDYKFCTESETREGLLKCRIFQVHPTVVKLVPYPSPKIYIVLKRWTLYRYVIDGIPTAWSSGLRTSKRSSCTNCYK